MKKSLFVVLALISFAVSVVASPMSLTGVLTDDMCTKKHMMPGKANSDCVLECIKHGAKYVVVSNGKVVEVQGKQEQLNELAGKKVNVTGALRGKVLVLTSVKAAQ